MTKSNEVAKNPFSGLFTALAVIFFLGGFYLVETSYFLNMVNRPWYLRLLLVLVTLVLSALCLKMTPHWNYLLGLAKGARIEYYKVDFPSRDEWLKSTMMVLAIVAVFAIFLSIIDLLLAWIINWIL